MKIDVTEVYMVHFTGTFKLLLHINS